MNRNPRRKVVGVEVSGTIKPRATVVLECGHRINCGVAVQYAKAKKRMACVECAAPEDHSTEPQEQK